MPVLQPVMHTAMLDRDVGRSGDNAYLLGNDRGLTACRDVGCSSSSSLPASLGSKANKFIIMPGHFASELNSQRDKLSRTSIILRP
jgi:hypothetical protein